MERGETECSERRRQRRKTEMGDREGETERGRQRGKWMQDIELEHFFILLSYTALHYKRIKKKMKVNCFSVSVKNFSS